MNSNPFVVRRKTNNNEDGFFNSKIEIEEETDFHQFLQAHEKEKQVFLLKGISYQLNILIKSFFKEPKCKLFKLIK